MISGTLILSKDESNEGMYMEKKRNISYIFLFFLIISLNGLAILFKEDKAISEYENRELAIRPEFTFDSIISGGFFQLFDKFISDQVYQKEFWQTQYVKLNLDVLNKHKINDFVVTDDNIILTYNSYSKNNLSQLDNDIKNAISSIKDAEKIVNENGGKLYFITAPIQSSMFKDYYPKYFNNGQEYYISQRNSIVEACEENQINYISMFDSFSTYNPSEIYHTTEHHYNFVAAYNIYKEIINTLNSEENLQFDRNIVTYKKLNVEKKGFNGVYNRQLMYLINHNDRLLLPHINTTKWEIFNNKKKVNGVIDYNRMRYSAFMYGDISETIMKTNKPEYDNALIIGDSFTNPLEPLIAMHFNETRSLDFRLNDVEVDFKNYIEEYKPKVVLVVNNEGSISSNKPNIIMKQN